MKKVVLLKELASSDISYGHLYKEYIKHLEIDIMKYFIEPSSLVDVACPGCRRRSNTIFI